MRYPAGGASPTVVKEVRRLKARMEAERLPRGVDPTRHLKLGRGGLSDVEWTAQLLQLQHAAEVPGLRTTSTPGALAAARDAGVLDEQDTALLTDAWMLASQLRNAVVLWTGRTGGASADLLPHDRRDLIGLDRLLGNPPGNHVDLADTYLRVARRARAVVDRVFYG